MKQIKTMLALLFTIVILAMGVLSTSASSSTMYVESVSGNAGELIIVPVIIDKNSGFVSLSLEVVYDESALTLKAVNDTGLIEGQYHSAQLESPYLLNWINDTDTTNTTVTGTITELQFYINDAAAIGNYTIELRMNKDDALDSNGNEVLFTLNAGTVTVSKPRHECSFGDWENYSKSKHIRYCQECDEYEMERHDWDDGVIIEEATHENDGEIRYTCADCGCTDDDVIYSDGHDFTAWSEYNATQHKRTCSCGEVEYADHVWDAGVITQEPTATTNGIRTFTCTACYATQTEEIIYDITPVTGITLSHESIYMNIGESFLLKATVLPNNASEQTVIWTCDNDSVIQINKAISNTNLVDLVALSEGVATITATTLDGHYSAQCTLVIINPDSVGVTLSSNIIYFTSVLRTKNSLVITNTGGKSIENVTISVNEGSSTGDLVYGDLIAQDQCSILNSGESYEWYFMSDRLEDNNIVYYISVRYTVESQEYVEYINVIVPSTVNGELMNWHDYSEIVNYNNECHIYKCSLHTECAATVSEPHWYATDTSTECVVCGFEREAPEHTHRFSAWTNHNATQHMRTCSCGEIEYANHTWDVGVITKEPSCLEQGIKTYTCSVCNSTKTDTLPTTGHSIKYIAAKEPTCTTYGNVEYWFCEDCGYAWLDEELTLNTALKYVSLEPAHQLVHVPAKSPTTTQNGNIEYWYCQVCGSAWLDEKCTLNTNLKAVILPASGLQQSDGLEYQLNEDGKSYTVIGLGSCIDLDVVIPDLYNGLPITGIGANAFAGSNITGIYIPSTIKTIGKSAFSKCKNLQATHIDSLEAWFEIEFASGFSNPIWQYGNLYIGGELLTELVIPKSVTKINAYAFYQCTSLVSVNASNVITINAYAFYGCGNLTSVVLNPALTTINKSTFGGCYSLRNITLPEALKTIGMQAFSNSGLETIHLPANLTTVGRSAFSGTDNLKNITVDKNNSCFEIVDNCLIDINRKELTFAWGDFIIPNDGRVISISAGAFFCSDIESLVLPEGIVKISNNAFDSCKKLTVITVPVSVTEIEKYAFAHCTELQTLIYQGTEEQWASVTKGTDWNLNSQFTITFTNDHTHSFSAWIFYSAEQHKRTCSCGKIEYAEHTWDNGVITTPPTATVVGIKTYTCTACSETKLEAIPATGEPEIGENDPAIIVKKVKAIAGETVTVDINFNNNPGLAGIAFDVYFDHTVLELVSYDISIGKGSFITSPDGKYADHVNFQLAGITNITDSGTLVSFSFKVKDNAPKGTAEVRVVIQDGTAFKYEGTTEVDLDIATASGGVEVIDYIRGDVNGDGSVNNRDASRLLQKLAGWDVMVSEDALDINGDGKVNIRDAARILQYLAGWDVELH